MEILAAIKLLGGSSLLHLKRTPRERVDIHAAIVAGLPHAALSYLADHLQEIPEGEVAQVVGVSARTLGRFKDVPDKPMPPALGSKTWQLAETLARAATLMGGKEAAERWMTRPAVGLDGQRPIDLLRTAQGAELVDDFLGRLEYGVYT